VVVENGYFLPRSSVIVSGKLGSTSDSVWLPLAVCDSGCGVGSVGVQGIELDRTGNRDNSPT